MMSDLKLPLRTQISSTSESSVDIAFMRREYSAALGIPAHHILLRDFKFQCQSKGLFGMKGIAMLFRGMDKHTTGTVNLNEFMEGLLRFEFTMPKDHIKAIFNYFDLDQNGQLEFLEFLQKLKPPLPPSRRAVVNEAFDKLDYKKRDIFTVEDIKVVLEEDVYDHIMYITGEWSFERVCQSFVDYFDLDNKGYVTRSSFIDYFSYMGLAIDDNCRFDIIMRDLWGLPPKHVVLRQKAERKYGTSVATTGTHASSEGGNDCFTC